MRVATRSRRKDFLRSDWALPSVICPTPEAEGDKFGERISLCVEPARDSGAPDPASNVDERVMSIMKISSEVVSAP